MAAPAATAASAQPPATPRGPGRLALAGAGLAMQAAWLLLWPLGLALTRTPDFTALHLAAFPPIRGLSDALLGLLAPLVPGLPGAPPSLALVALLGAAFGLAALGYLAGLAVLASGAARLPGALALVVGLTLLSQALLLPLPGVFTTDPFSYLLYGRISGVYGLNPYVAPPSAFPQEPLLGWIHPLWRETPSVYGPVWEALAGGLARLLRPLGLIQQVLALKLVVNGLHLLGLGLLWWLLGRLGPTTSRADRVTAFAVYAWNPLVLFEFAAGAHNDALMVLLVFVALVPLARLEVASPARPASPAWLASLLAVTLAGLAKAAAALVAPFIAVAWARRLDGWRQRSAWLGLAALLALALVVLLSWPWLPPPRTLDPLLAAAGGPNRTINSVPDLLALTISDQALDPAGLDRPAAQPTARGWVDGLSRAAFGVYLLWEAWGVWRQASVGPRQAARAAVRAAARAFLVLLLLPLRWVLAWYFTWPLALVPLLGWRDRLARLVVAYSLAAVVVFNVRDFWYVAAGEEMPGSLLVAYAFLPLLALVGGRSRSEPA